MKLSATLIFGTLLFVTSASAAVDIIRCTSQDHPQITVTVGERKLERSVACIRGEFVADMTPCAPNHGYGLSRPTGLAGLVKIVDRWQDYVDHVGGIAGFHSSPDEMSFTGSFGGSDEKITTLYKFTIDRTTGQAKLEATDAKEKKYTAKYVCAKAKQKF